MYFDCVNYYILKETKVERVVWTKRGMELKITNNWKLDKRDKFWTRIFFHMEIQLF